MKQTILDVHSFLIKVSLNNPLCRWKSTDLANILLLILGRHVASEANLIQEILSHHLIKNRIIGVVFLRSLNQWSWATAVYILIDLLRIIACHTYSSLSSFKQRTFQSVFISVFLCGISNNLEALPHCLQFQIFRSCLRSSIKVAEPFLITRLVRIDFHFLKSSAGGR